MILCVLFFAFALGVAAGEKSAQEETAPTAYTIQDPKMQAAKSETAEPFAEPAEVMLDPLCEDTYLIAGHPLSFELQAMLYGACLEFGIDYDLALAVIEQETNFRNVTGDDGESVGYMQIQRKWWGDLMEEIGSEDLTDPEDNFRTGCAIIRELLDRYGSTEDALSAYNTGHCGSTQYSRSVFEKLNG